MTDVFKPETVNLFSEAFVSQVDKALISKRASQPKRQYLGASLWGETCERKLGYIFHQQPEDEGSGFTANTLRIFDMGHDCEDRVAEYVKVAGFELVTHKADGGQFGFEAAEGKLKGHIDGVITGGPVFPQFAYPVLWENKGLNNKSWNDTLKKGVKTSKPLYYSQAQTYMAYMELTNGCVFTFLNRDSGELASEFLPFDARQAQESSDRAVRVIKSSRPTELSKCTNDPADFRCKWCNFKRTCWDAGITTVTTEDTLPSWLRKK